ncbi:hypothetical protein V8G54_034290 [Vigna mungo]|uniref:Uncharacterized protein n=1 Tax=Vigna mungo TaxID=3915 RepID=A0AAQ3RJL0_VIGMU
MRRRRTTAPSAASNKLQHSQPHFPVRHPYAQSLLPPAAATSSQHHERRSQKQTPLITHKIRGLPPIVNQPVQHIESASTRLTLSTPSAPIATTGVESASPSTPYSPPPTPLPLSDTSPS